MIPSYCAYLLVYFKALQCKTLGSMLERSISTLIFDQSATNPRGIYFSQAGGIR